MVQNVEMDGGLARHLEDEIAHLAYSLVADPPALSSLQHQLDLARASLTFLQSQLQHLRSQHHSLLLNHQKAQEEATLNAAALKHKVEENEMLKERCEQLSRECELYHRDREVFSEAADDAEERRAEAELNTAEAEQRAMNAERRLEKAVCFIKLNFKDSLADELDLALFEDGGRRRTSFDQSSSSSTTLPRSPLPPKPCQRSSLITPKKEEDECKKSPFSSESKRRQSKQSPTNRRAVLSNTMNHHSPLQPFKAFCNDTDQKALSPGEQNKSQKIYSTSRQSSGKENMQFHSGDKKFRQVAKSDVERLKVEIGHVVSLLKNGQSYLSRAEVEAELIKAKEWELQALFKDKFSSFGVPSSELSETGSGGGLEPSIENNSRWLGVPKVADSIISRFRKDKKPRVER